MENHHVKTHVMSIVILNSYVSLPMGDLWESQRFDAQFIGLWRGPNISTREKKCLVGGELAYPSETSEDSSIGMMNFPTEWINNPVMFQTTNQVFSSEICRLFGTIEGGCFSDGIKVIQQWGSELPSGFTKHGWLENHEFQWRYFCQRKITEISRVHFPVSIFCVKRHDPRVGLLRETSLRRKHGTTPDF